MSRGCRCIDERRSWLQDLFRGAARSVRCRREPSWAGGQERLGTLTSLYRYPVKVPAGSEKRIGSFNLFRLVTGLNDLPSPAGWGASLREKFLTIAWSDVIRKNLLAGGMAEWFKAAVLKTAVPKGAVGSNPTPSATPSWQRSVRPLLSRRHGHTERWPSRLKALAC
ncbi:hypothetical protein TRIP_B200400 [uncultured Desulfatiglans sp.]|uniref:Uncharacterized protein n=1 Tax=Uncultured Desulfatiglans sp. TaxID=1748965 RepID=A0A653A2L2_UNCDX|nr:hypothetical protein TRIP_B200400 [uncultured Desulfatiglans sp.]